MGKRLRGDMIEVYKIMHGMEDVDRETFPPSLKILDPGEADWGDKMKYFFIQCIVKLWNSLPQDIVMAINLDGFKRELDKFLEEKAINGY